MTVRMTSCTTKAKKTEEVLQFLKTFKSLVHGTSECLELPVICPRSSPRTGGFPDFLTNAASLKQLNGSNQPYPHHYIGTGQSVVALPSTLNINCSIVSAVTHWNVLNLKYKTAFWVRELYAIMDKSLSISSENSSRRWTHALYLLTNTLFI